MPSYVTPRTLNATMQKLRASSSANLKAAQKAAQNAASSLAIVLQASLERAEAHTCNRSSKESKESAKSHRHSCHCTHTSPTRRIHPPTALMPPTCRSYPPTASFALSALNAPLSPSRRQPPSLVSRSQPIIASLLPAASHSRPSIASLPPSASHSRPSSTHHAHSTRASCTFSRANH